MDKLQEALEIMRRLKEDITAPFDDQREQYYCPVCYEPLDHNEELINGTHQQGCAYVKMLNFLTNLNKEE